MKQLRLPLLCGRHDCAGPACADYLEPVAGTVTRRLGACLRAIAEADDAIGQPVAMSQARVGWHLGLSDVRVSQVEAAALAKLRKRMGSADGWERAEGQGEAA